MDDSEVAKEHKVYDFTTNWFDPGLPQWSRLIQEFASKPVIGLEIGCFEGRSAVWILENVCTHPDSKLTTIDTFEGSPEFSNGFMQIPIEIDKMESRFRSNITATGKANQVEIVKGKSFETLATWNSCNSNAVPKFDFVYVDAGHEANSVQSDANLVWPLLKHNGIMIFDDYGLRRYAEPYNNPHVGIDGFVAAYSQEIDILESNYQLAVRKVKRERTYTIIDSKTGSQ
ncbi:hypothetical protein HA402_010869 [Bradysia odoriphaga]|nr:hypothetical protein HA402_010869 [Bradysia odoriphaga]